MTPAPRDMPTQQEAVLKGPLRWPFVASFILSNEEGLDTGDREEQVFCGEKKLVMDIYVLLHERG